MAICKFCGVAFAWGQKDDGKYVPLVPLGEEGDLVRNYQDENGVLRAEHALVCKHKGGPTVRVSRLARSVKGSDVLPSAWTPPDKDGVIFEKADKYGSLTSA